MFHCCCCSCRGVGSCVPKLGTQHVLHSTSLVLQSREFVSARPCISSRRVPSGSLSAGFALSSGSLNSQLDCVMHLPHCSACIACTCQPTMCWDRDLQWGIRWENVRFWAVQILCINNFKHSCSRPLWWQVITSCRMCAECHRWTVKVYKGAETWAQTGHRSGGQVQLDLVHAAWHLHARVMQRNVKYSSKVLRVFF